LFEVIVKYALECELYFYASHRRIASQDEGFDAYSYNALLT
jgi:hypothetical protein